MLTNLPSFETLDAVQHWSLELLLQEGAFAAPRGLATRELLAAGFCLANPRARKIGSTARGWSEVLAIGEFAWHVSGSTEVAPIAYYASRWRDFSEDGQYIRGSCYGSRIFGSENGSPSQWDRLIQILRDDPATRRAILTVMQPPEDTLSAASVDVPCVSSCQFLIREGRLHAIVKMRSNDVVWGLPYDVFLFTMLQEMLACELSLELGSYFHVAGSFHLYDRHVSLAQRIIDAGICPADPMNEMPGLGGLREFLQLEHELRTKGSSEVNLPDYWATLAAPLSQHAAKIREAV